MKLQNGDKLVDHVCEATWQQALYVKPANRTTSHDAPEMPGQPMLTKRIWPD